MEALQRHGSSLRSEPISFEDKPCQVGRCPHLVEADLQIYKDVFSIGVRFPGDRESAANA